MPKQPPTRDRFRVLCDVDTDEEMGRVVGTLTRLGFKNVGFELITDVATFNQQPKYDMTGDTLAAAWVAEHPTFEVNDVVQYFKAQGRNGSSAYPAIRKLCDTGVLKRTGPGNYQHANVKALSPPPAKKPHGNSGAARRQFEVTGNEAIWTVIGDRQKFKIKELTDAFRAQGRNPNSVSPLVTKMHQAKQVKLLGDGEYAVVKRPKPPAHVKKPAEATTNGAEPAHA